MSEREAVLVVLALAFLTGCLGGGFESSASGEVVENPPANLTGLQGDELRVRADGNALLIAYDIEDRDIVGETEAAVEVIASNDSTRHYCPGDASGVLRVHISDRVREQAGYAVTLWEDDRLLPTTPCRNTDGGFGTQGSIETALWSPQDGSATDER